MPHPLLLVERANECESHCASVNVDVNEACGQRIKVKVDGAANFDFLVFGGFPMKTGSISWLSYLKRFFEKQKYNFKKSYYLKFLYQVFYNLKLN